MVSLEELVARRNIQKGKIQRIELFLTQVQVQDGHTLHKLAFDKRLTDLDATYEATSKILDNIELLSQAQEHMQERINIENAYYSLCENLSNYRDSLFQETVTPPSQTSRSSFEFKLPTLKLPEFDGKMEEYFSFKNFFQAVLGEYEGLSDIHKFYYLRGALKGTAASVIQGLPSSTDAYHLAWELLEAGFLTGGL